MATKITNICELINHFERKYGNMNEFFFAIFEGIMPNKVTMELFYYYDSINGFDIDFEEYLARYDDRPFEWKLEKTSVIAKEVIKTIKHSVDYKPVDGVVNRNKRINFYR